MLDEIGGLELKSPIDNAVRIQLLVKHVVSYFELFAIQCALLMIVLSSAAAKIPLI